MVVNYDVAGAAGVNYSETFDAGYTESWSNFFPIVTEVDYFGVGKGCEHGCLGSGHCRLVSQCHWSFVKGNEHMEGSRRKGCSL